MQPPQDRDKLIEVLSSANAARCIPRDRILEELAKALSALGSWRDADRSLPADVLEARLDEQLGLPSLRLAAYGSLRLGRENHHLIADLGGTWQRGRVRGALHPGGGEGTERWPRLTSDESGPDVEVEVLESHGLPGRWDELDRFEGLAYRRLLIVVELADERLTVANAYVRA
jgi:gamma-glutamylcyclotransferase (GGCT)/AIG2-like uncharacterized protein YtfP